MNIPYALHDASLVIFTMDNAAEQHRARSYAVAAEREPKESMWNHEA